MKYLKRLSAVLLMILYFISVNGHASHRKEDGTRYNNTDEYGMALAGDMNSLGDAARMDGVADYIGGVSADYLRGMISNRAAHWIGESIDESMRSNERVGSPLDFVTMMKEDAELNIQIKEGIKRRMRGQLQNITRDVIAERVFGDINDDAKRREAIDIADRTIQEIDENMGDRIDATVGVLYSSVVERMDEMALQQMFNADVRVGGVNALIELALSQDDISYNVSRALGEIVGDGMVISIRKRIGESLDGSLPPEALGALAEGPKAFEEYMSNVGDRFPIESLEEILNSVLNFPALKLPTPAYASILAASAAGHFARAFKGLYVDPYELRRGTEVVRVMIWQIKNKEAINLSLMQLGSIVGGLTPKLNINLSIEEMKKKLSKPLWRIDQLNAQLEGLLGMPIDKMTEAVESFSQEMVESLEQLQVCLADFNVEGDIESVSEVTKEPLVGDVFGEFTEGILEPIDLVGEDYLDIDTVSFDEINMLGPAAEILDGELVPYGYLPFSSELDPVLLHSGEYYSEVTDLMIPGVGIDFKFTRIYRGRSFFLGEFGWRWTHSYAERLLTSEGGLTYIDGRGRKFFIENRDGGFEPPAEFFINLIRSKGGGYKIQTEEGVITSFNKVGLPIEKKDRYGNHIEYRYDKGGLLREVIDTYGRRVLFHRRADGLIEAVEDFTGRRVNYKYNKYDELIGVSSPITIDYPGGRTTAYRYERGLAGTPRTHLITMIVDPKGQVYLRNRYDSKGRVTEQRYGDRPWVRVEYDNEDTTSVVDSLGVERLYKFDEYGHITDSFRIDDDERSLIKSHRYDGRGRRISTCRPSGRCRRYDYDTKFRWPIKIEELPSDKRESRITTIRREPVFGRPLLIVDAVGRETEFKYTRTWPHSLIEVCTTLESDNDNRVIESYSHNECGQLVKFIDPNGFSTKFEYNPSKDPDGDFNPTGIFQTDGDFKCGYLRSIDDGGVKNFRYDPVGNIIAIERRDKRTELFGVNSLNQIVAEHLPGEAPRSYTFDANDNLIEVKTIDGEHSILQKFEYGTLDNVTTAEKQVADGVFAKMQYEYDAKGRLLGTEYPEGNRKEYEYDRNDNLKCVLHGVGSLDMTKECYVYDVDGDIIGYTNGAGATTLFERNGFGEVEAAVDPLGNKVLIKQDGVGRVIEKSHSDRNDVLLSKTKYRYGLLDGPVQVVRHLWNDRPELSRPVATRYGYDDSGELISVTNAMGGKTSLKRDRFGNVISIADAASTERVFVRDPFGNAIDEYFNSNGERLKILRRKYDDAGRLTEYNYGTGESWRLSYDGVGNLISIQNPYEAKIGYEHDDLGRTISVTKDDDGELLVSRYVWDLNGRLVKAIDVSGGETNFFYDSLNRLIVEEYPDESKRQITYNDANDIIGVVGRGGGRISIAVDRMGRILTRIASSKLGWIPSVKQEFGYDGLGRLVKTVDGDLENHFVYDSLSRRIAEKVKEGWVVRGYDDVGRVISLKHPRGLTFFRTYDAMGRVKGILHGKRRISSFHYDATGDLTEQRFGDDMYLELGRDRWGRMFRKNYFRDKGVSMGWHEIHRDDQGEVSFEIGNYDVKRSYERDSLGRLVEVVDSVKHSEKPLLREWKYDLDLFGNIATDHVIKYDDGGRIEGIDDRVFKYDALGRLVWTMDGTIHTDYSYDAFDRMVGVSTNGIQKSFVWDGWNMLGEDGADGLFIYIYYDGFNAPIAFIDEKELGYFQTDRLGSVTGVVAEDGKRISQCGYDPYGNRYECKNFNRPFCFTGHICEGDPNLIFMRYRHYDVTTGRFLTPDPLGLKISLRSGSNTYAGPNLSYHRMQGGASHLTFTNRMSIADKTYGVYPFNRIYYKAGSVIDGELNLYLYAKADPSRFVDPLGLASLIFDRSDERIYLRDRYEMDIMEFRATNNAKIPWADPFLREGNGPFPEGSYPISIPRFYSEEYRQSFYERYELEGVVPGESIANGAHWKKYPQDRPDYSIAFGSVRMRAGFGPEEPVWDRELFMHGGRHDYRKGTLGCIRVDDRDLDDMAALYIIYRRLGDPVEVITVRD